MPTTRPHQTVRAVAIAPSRPGHVQHTTLDVPEPGPGEVEITLIRVGVCGTDRELIRGEIGFPPTGAGELVLGHEMVGRVSKLGPDVATLAVGDLVTATVRRPDACPAC